MRQLALILAVVTSTLGASAAMAAANGAGGPGPGPSIECNYDLWNTGSQDAFDVAIVLKGNVTCTDFWADFFPSTPTVTTSGGNTVLHWTNSDPAPPIAHGGTGKVHVGYTPSGTTDCAVLDIYWTDANGHRVPSSFVGVAENHTTGVNVNITNLSFTNILVQNVRIACQAAALPLGALNATNSYLSKAMVTIGDSATVAPGQSWSIPFQPSCSQCYCVTNYQTSGDGLAAIFSPWVQEYVP